jgi:hypothetical protein
MEEIAVKVGEPFILNPARLPANEEAVEASETTPSNPYPVAVE